jgi:FkbM family methyltransferase
MNNFRSALEKKLIKSRYNSFGVDNYDEYRFGEFPNVNTPTLGTSVKIKRVIKKIIGFNDRQFLNSYLEFFVKYEDGLQGIYEQISSEGKALLVDIIAFRLLGYKMVKLSRNNKEYWATLEITNSLLDRSDSYDPHLLHFILYKFDLKKIGYDIRLYFPSIGIANDFMFEQYSFKVGDKAIVNVEKGDVVLDLGACWGDTALYFASKTGGDGKVYSFEFIPGNIKLFTMNTSLNPNLLKRIELVQYPVSDKSGETIYFTDNGPGSRIKIEPFEGQSGFASTISIDDFVKNSRIGNVDFIKMDIEGAETLALQGAINTIKKFKPKLAIAIYHNMDDFVNIPRWIIKLNLGYNLYLGHYTIHSEETIIFAKVER